MPDFEQLSRMFTFFPIRDCPGRYVLKGGVDARLEELVRAAPEARAFDVAGVRDRVWVVAVLGGGLISYERADRSMVHTLGNESGFRRRLAAFGLEAPSTPT